MPVRHSVSAATVADCLTLLVDGDTLVHMPDGRLLVSGVVDLRAACPTAGSIAREIIDKGYVSELPRRSFRGSVAEYDITADGEEAAAHAARRRDRRARHAAGSRRRATTAATRG